MNTLQNLHLDLPRGVVITPRGDQLPIKTHNGWQYINYQGVKIGVNKLKPYTAVVTDCVHDYIFENGFINYPCPAMDYWIIRHRLKKKISYTDFKKQYSQTFIHRKPR